MIVDVNGEPLIILVIEDNADHAELIFRCFEKHRIMNKVIHIEDGETALEYMFGQNKFADREKYPIPNLVLLDLRIPKIDGLEVLTKIKTNEKLKYIPVVILTSSENQKDIQDAYQSYVNSYLVKPVDFIKFTQMMEELGFYWLGLNNQIY